MSPAVKNPPENYHNVTPYLHIKGAAAAIDFYKNAFGAKELFRLAQPDGRIGHAEIMIGDSAVMLADENPEMGVVGPASLGNTSVSLLVYVNDSDEVFKKAMSLGSIAKKPMTDQFYGDRSGTLIDPFGHMWTVATHKEDVSPEEMERRMAAFTAK